MSLYYYWNLQDLKNFKTFSNDLTQAIELGVPIKIKKLKNLIIR